VAYVLYFIVSYKNGGMCVWCMYCMLSKRCYLQCHIQGDLGGKLNILGADSIGHCEEKMCI
jgi:hypothetical protein